jgi:hypothetical protein
MFALHAVAFKLYLISPLQLRNGFISPHPRPLTFCLYREHIFQFFFSKTNTHWLRQSEAIQPPYLLLLIKMINYIEHFQTRSSAINRFSKQKIILQESGISAFRFIYTYVHIYESREIENCGHESRGTRKQEWLCWRGQQQYTLTDLN